MQRRRSWEQKLQKMLKKLDPIAAAFAPNILNAHNIPPAMSMDDARRLQAER